MSIQRVQSAYTALRSPTTDTEKKLMSASGIAAINTIATMAADEDSTGTGTQTRTPDYHLPFTGDQVVAALWKIINLNPNQVGGQTVLESSATDPADIDKVLDAGFYTVYYLKATDLPEELIGISPLTLRVYIDAEGNIIQVLEGAGAMYARYTKDRGRTWSDWQNKLLNTQVDPTPDPSERPEPAPDPFEVLDGKVEDLEEELDNQDTRLTYAENVLNENLPIMAYYGTAETGKQILDGTYDYDSETPAPFPDLPEDDDNPIPRAVLAKGKMPVVVAPTVQA